MRKIDAAVNSARHKTVYCAHCSKHVWKNLLMGSQAKGVRRRFQDQISKRVYQHWQKDWALSNLSTQTNTTMYLSENQKQPLNFQIVFSWQLLLGPSKCFREKAPYLLGTFQMLFLICRMITKNKIDIVRVLQANLWSRRGFSGGLRRIQERFMGFPEVPRGLQSDAEGLWCIQGRNRDVSGAFLDTSSRSVCDLFYPIEYKI